MEIFKGDFLAPCHENFSPKQACKPWRDDGCEKREKRFGNSSETSASWIAALSPMHQPTWRSDRWEVSLIQLGGLCHTDWWCMLASQGLPSTLWHRKVLGWLLWPKQVGNRMQTRSLVNGEAQTSPPSSGIRTGHVGLSSCAYSLGIPVSDPILEAQNSPRQDLPLPLGETNFERFFFEFFWETGVVWALVWDMVIPIGRG